MNLETNLETALDSRRLSTRNGSRLETIRDSRRFSKRRGAAGLSQRAPQDVPGPETGYFFFFAAFFFVPFFFAAFFLAAM